jgi:hypothetical protein
VLNLLGRSYETGAQHGAFFDFVDQFLTFLDQAFHGNALHPFQADAASFDHLVDPLDLSLRLFQMCLERVAQLRIGCGAAGLRQRPGELLPGTLDVRQHMNEEVVDRFTLNHDRLLERLGDESRATRMPRYGDEGDPMWPEAR